MKRKITLLNLILLLTAAASFTSTAAQTGGKLDYSLAHVWRDNADSAGIRPESVHVDLYRNGYNYDSAELSEYNGWTWVFEDLPYDGSFHAQVVEKQMGVCLDGADTVKAEEWFTAEYSWNSGNTKSFTIRNGSDAEYPYCLIPENAEAEPVTGLAPAHAAQEVKLAAGEYRGIKVSYRIDDFEYEVNVNGISEYSVKEWEKSGYTAKYETSSEEKDGRQSVSTIITDNLAVTSKSTDIVLRWNDTELNHSDTDVILTAGGETTELRFSNDNDWKQHIELPDGFTLMTAETPVAASQEERFKDRSVAIVGDVTTEGSNDASWWGELAAHTGLRIISKLSYSDLKSADREEIKEKLRTEEDEPEIIMVCFGFKDFLDGRPVDAIKTDLAELCLEIREAYPASNIMLTTNAYTADELAEYPKLYEITNMEQHLAEAYGYAMNELQIYYGFIELTSEEPVKDSILSYT